ncbi:MAG: M50 family metallopeptidase, partial [Candidatus Promineifilaceae bacterium]
MSFLWMIGGFVLVLSPIIIVHELGHFWAARWFNIRVDEFGLGFPPRAATLFERNGTAYTLNWIPLGGFVRPAGEDDDSIEGGLAAASKTARFTVLVMGAVFNFIFAFLILWLAYFVGEPVNEISVGEMQAGNVAEVAGLQLDDVFMSINGEEVGGNSSLLISIISASPNEAVEVIVERSGELVPLTVTPAPSEADASRGVLGIRLNSEPTGNRVSLGFAGAARESWSVMYEVVSLTLNAPRMLLQGALTPQEARPISVVGISQIVGAEAESASRTGDWFGLLFFAGIINVGLGFTNLLPIPALDGGRILFVIIEAIRGRKMEPGREGMVHLVGMLLLLGLMALMIV